MLAILIVVARSPGFLSNHDPFKTQQVTRAASLQLPTKYEIKTWNTQNTQKTPPFNTCQQYQGCYYRIHKKYKIHKKTQGAQNTQNTQKKNIYFLLSTKYERPNQHTAQKNSQNLPLLLPRPLKAQYKHEIYEHTSGTAIQSCYFHSDMRCQGVR